MTLGLNESVRYGTYPDADYSIAWRSDGNTMNTRQLGSQIIRTIKPDAIHTKPASSEES